MSDLRLLWSKKKVLEQRAFIFKRMRDFFDGRGFLEVETPIVSPYTCCEPTIRVLETKVHDDKHGEETAFLLPSPELFLKQILGAGYEKIYSISRCFRDGESWESKRHNIEFSMLEWYRAGEPYESLMEDIAGLFLHLNEAFGLGQKLNYQGKSYDLKKIRKISVKECFKHYAKIDFDRFDSFDELIKIAKARKYGDFESLDDAFYIIFLNEIEPYLGTETFDIVYEYPHFQSALAKKTKDGLYAKRFEVYVGGMELANAYEELCDPNLLRGQLLAFNEENKRLRGKAFPFSEGFIESLGQLEVASGIALGLDRFMMLFCNKKSIKEVLTFPFEKKN